MQRSTGFTLIEILVALTLTAVIGSAAYACFYVAMDAGDISQEQARKLYELDRAMSIMERDLQQVIARSVVTGYNESQSAFEGQPEIQFDTLEEYLLRFTRDGWLNPRQQHRSELLRVGYRVFEGSLWRDHWVHIDVADDEAPTRLKLLDGVESIRVRYLGFDQDPQAQEPQRWVAEWPVGLGIGASEALPLAVEVTFELEEWGEIKRLFMLPAS